MIIYPFLHKLFVEMSALPVTGGSYDKFSLLSLFKLHCKRSTTLCILFLGSWYKWTYLFGTFQVHNLHVQWNLLPEYLKGWLVGQYVISLCGCRNYKILCYFPQIKQCSQCIIKFCIKQVTNFGYFWRSLWGAVWNVHNVVFLVHFKFNNDVHNCNSLV